MENPELDCTAPIEALIGALIGHHGVQIALTCPAKAVDRVDASPELRTGRGQF
jgi:hypothetical protein